MSERPEVVEALGVGADLTTRELRDIWRTHPADLAGWAQRAEDMSRRAEAAEAELDKERGATNALARELDAVRAERDKAVNAALAERLRAREAEAERDKLRAVFEEAEAVAKNWRGNARGWVNPDRLAPNMDALRAALGKK